MAYPNRWKLATLCLAVAVAYLWTGSRRPAPGDFHFVPLTVGGALTASPAISADGQLAAYASDRDADNLELYLQPIPSGMPVRLTHTGDDESEPAFSPGSGSLAFRSEKSGGAIFVMPARGGEAKLLAPRGHDPRYSPDGRWIAYWDEETAWVIPSGGGTPRKIFPGLAARKPVWSPDGSRVMALNGEDFVVGDVGGTPAPAGIRRDHPDSPCWTSAGLFFVQRTGWVRDLWRLPLDEHGRPAGDALRVTSGPESIGDAAVSREGRIVFTAGSQSFQVWALPLDANTGKPAGAPYRLTDGAATAEHPAVSADGTRLLYDAQRYGLLQQLFLRDLSSGEERVVASAPKGVSGGRFLRGGRIIYGSGGDVYLAGETRALATGARPLAVDGKEEIALLRAGDSVDALSLKSLERAPFLRGAISQADFSPDDRWVAFASAGRIYRARTQGLREIPRSEWLPVASGDKPRFSPDGSLIYFTGARAIYAVRSDGQGEPFPVWEPRRPRLSMAAVNPAALEIGVARDKLVVLLAESVSNLWMADR